MPTARRRIWSPIASDASAKASPRARPRSRSSAPSPTSFHGGPRRPPKPPGRRKIAASMPPTPEVIDAIGRLLSPLLGTLERVGWVQRHFYPPDAPKLAKELATGRDTLAEPLRAFETLAWPDDLHFMRDRLADGTRQPLELVTGFVEAAKSPDDLLGLYRALRRFARIQETLYPLAPVFEPVSRWLLEPTRRDDA